MIDENKISHMIFKILNYLLLLNVLLCNLLFTLFYKNCFKNKKMNLLEKSYTFVRFNKNILLVFYFNFIKITLH